MRYSIGLSNEVLDTITNNDYLFCEDKVISLVSKYYGTEYEMAYARCFNFQYKINNTITKVGDKIILYYKDTIELLKKYYGISMTSATCTPAPLAMRFFLLGLSRFGFLRSCGVME